MRKVLIMTIVFIMLTTVALSETVIRKNVMIHFSDVDREGQYTGEINENGMPNGFGLFEAVNSKGRKYIIVGEWINGICEGEAWRAMDNGEQYIGTFSNGDLVKGKVLYDAKEASYDKALDTSNGYTPDSLINVDWKKLDDESIIQLISNVFNSQPVEQSKMPGYIWLSNGYTFCDFNISGVYASVNDKGNINTVSYLMKNFELIEQLIARLNARIGKTGIVLIDNKSQGNDKLTEKIKYQIEANALTNKSCVFSYTWGFDKGIIFNCTMDTGDVLFTMQKE